MKTYWVRGPNPGAGVPPRREGTPDMGPTQRRQAGNDTGETGASRSQGTARRPDGHRQRLEQTRDGFPLLPSRGHGPQGSGKRRICCCPQVARSMASLWWPWDRHLQGSARPRRRDASLRRRNPGHIPQTPLAVAGWPPRKGPACCASRTARPPPALTGGLVCTRGARGPSFGCHLRRARGACISALLVPSPLSPGHLGGGLHTAGRAGFLRQLSPPRGAGPTGGQGTRTEPTGLEGGPRVSGCSPHICSGPSHLGPPPGSPPPALPGGTPGGPWRAVGPTPASSVGLCPPIHPAQSRALTA